MDPATVTALVAGGASLFGGWMGNRSSAGEARRNRQFQERMRNTSWQAAVQDMEAAGINPAVAYAKGGAAVPGGSMASQSDIVSPAVSSGMQARMMDRQLKLLEAQTRGAAADAKVKQHQASVAAADDDERTARWSYYFNPNGTAKAPLVELLRAEHGSKMANNASAVTNLENLKFSQAELASLSKMWQTIGASGKGVQSLMPLILQILRRR